MNYFKKLLLRKVALKQLEQAKRLANERFKAHGHERHYVLGQMDGSLTIITRRDFKELKRKRKIPASATLMDVERECFYATPYRNGSGALAPEEILRKRDEFLRWYTSIYLLQKAKKKHT